ncbi:tetratricopeptide repeat protein [Actinoplanes sp. NPDC020271]|uniref:tetratricopeptide repeat protein n=1 Tax=Actinoplanes sp. NPDC020271 TaxID=3363896 RepID=UPI0037B6B781
MTAASRARLLVELGRFDQAEAELRLGLLNRPGDPDMLALLAAVLRLDGRHGDALAAAEAAIEAGPGSAGAHAERAENLIALSRTREAVEAASEAARLRPAEPEVHRVLARAHAAGRDFGRARAAARQALAFDPRSVPSLLTLAEVERVAGRRRAAARATRAALAEDPEHPGGRWLIALLNAERLHVGEAMRGLRDLAVDHPARLRAEALAWPILGVLAGLRRGLAVGVPLTLAVRLATPWWSLAGLFAQGIALVVAVVMLTFTARVLLPAGRMPWRCLALLPRRLVVTELVAAGVSVPLLVWYAMSARWLPLALAVAAVSALIISGAFRMRVTSLNSR